MTPPKLKRVLLTEQCLVMVYELKKISFLQDPKQLISAQLTSHINKGINLSQSRLGIDQGAIARFSTYLITNYN